MLAAILMAASASTITLEAPPGSYALLRIGGADVFARRHGSPAIELHHSVRFLEMHSLEGDAPLGGGTLAELAVLGRGVAGSDGPSELRFVDGSSSAVGLSHDANTLVVNGALQLAAGLKLCELPDGQPASFASAASSSSSSTPSAPKIKLCSAFSFV